MTRIFTPGSCGAPTVAPALVLRVPGIDADNRQFLVQLGSKALMLLQSRTRCEACTLISAPIVSGVRGNHALTLDIPINDAN